MFVIIRTDNRDKYIYSGNKGKNWVTKDDSNVDTWENHELAFEAGQKIFNNKKFEFGKHWNIVEI